MEWFMTLTLGEYMISVSQRGLQEYLFLPCLSPPCNRLAKIVLLSTLEFVVLVKLYYYLYTRVCRTMQLSTTLRRPPSSLVYVRSSRITKLPYGYVAERSAKPIKHLTSGLYWSGTCHMLLIYPASQLFTSSL